MIKPETYWAEPSDDRFPDMEPDTHQVRFSYSTKRLRSGCVLYQLTRSTSVVASVPQRGPRRQIDLLRHTSHLSF
jgi:hypothetical protein